MPSRPEPAAGDALAPGGFPVTIGEAARQSGVSPKMVRHYESLGLLGTVSRTDGGYRLYSAADVHTLRFVRRARDLGFSMAEIAELVNLWHDRSRASASVQRIALRHVQELSARIASLQSMQRTLEQLLHHCHGDARPDCPILDDLAGLGTPASPGSAAEGARGCTLHAAPPSGRTVPA